MSSARVTTAGPWWDFVRRFRRTDFCVRHVSIGCRKRRCGDERLGDWRDLFSVWIGRGMHRASRDLHRVLELETMMMGYPWIYWVALALVAGAVSTVLIGVGYLLGLRMAARRVLAVRDELERNREARRTMMTVEWRP